MYNDEGYAIVHNWLANFVLRKNFPEEHDGKLATIGNIIVPLKAPDYVTDDFGRLL